MLKSSLILVAVLAAFTLKTKDAAPDLDALARSGDLEAVREILPPDQEHEPAKLGLALHEAARNGHDTIVAYLLRLGAAPDRLTDHESPLQMAARGNHVAVLALLIAAGVDPNIIGGEDSTTALHDAAQRGNLEAARYLLENGADVNARSIWEHPAIHLAAEEGHGEMVALLREMGAQPKPVPELQAGALEEADLALGQEIAEDCRGCHALNPGERAPGNFPAPNLANVLGRPKASLADFRYTDAFKQLSGSWTVDELNRFIADPTGVAPGTTMIYAGVEDPDERIAVIAYLGSLAVR